MLSGKTCPRCTPASGTVFTRGRFHTMLNFLENEGDSRKMKKLLVLVQHFNEQSRYVTTKNISIDKSLINHKEEKREGEKLQSLNKSKTKVYIHLMFAINLVWLYVVCRVMLGEIPYKVRMFLIQYS